MARETPVFGVTEFVAYTNQTLEYAYPYVSIVGELANFKISKNKWVYFDIKDTESRVRCFGTVYMLASQLEDGMMVQIQGSPRLHPQFGFSLTVQQVQPVGEGAINRAAKLLEQKLEKEGLFDVARKRSVLYPPVKIGLITSAESAAYADFMKIISHRWGQLDIYLADVQVQGSEAPGQVAAALQALNQLPHSLDVIVMIRGGGSAEDLQAFSEESVVRAVAASRIPTVVAIGHENDVALAERAADVRASTPSNAAELLVPDKQQVAQYLEKNKRTLYQALESVVEYKKQQVKVYKDKLHESISQLFRQHNNALQQKQLLLHALNPEVVLQRGYALVRKDNQIIRSGLQLKKDDTIELQFKDSILMTNIIKIRRNDGKK